MKLKNCSGKGNPWLSFSIFCFGVFLFYLTCTRLFVKMDDGHFLGILHNSGFQLGAWLRMRYQTVSGRTLNEALMMTLLRSPLLLWKLSSAALLCLVAWFLCKVSLALPGDSLANNKVSFACAASFLVLPSCMAAAAFWFAGSFTYLWTAAALLLCVAPAAFLALDIAFKPWLSVLSVVAAPLAASQEQAAAATLALLACLQVILLLQKKWRVQGALPLAPAAIASYFLFSSPGAQLRSAMEAKSSFPAFLQLSFLEKLLAGGSNYFAYAFYLSIPVTTAFLLVLYQNIWQRGAGKRGRTVLIFHGICWGILCLGGNACAFLARRGNPDMIFERMFTQWKVDAVGVGLLAVSLLFFASMVGLLLWLVRQQAKAGLSAGLCVAAAVGCGLAPGFSGSLYASGQRIFFFSDLFFILATVLLFGNAANTKQLQRLRTGVTALALAFFLFYVAGFQLLELPPMG
jgi:hypothetical protein